MKLSTIAVTVGVLLALAAGFLFWQHQSAKTPSLQSIPGYEPSFPVTDIGEPQARQAQTRLRDFATSLRPGYRVADERFLATRDALKWDALRHVVGLESRHYARVDDGWSADNAITYTLYEPEGRIRQWFNAERILIAGFVDEALSTAAGNPVHLYGYFTLTPN